MGSQEVALPPPPPGFVEKPPDLPPPPEGFVDRASLGPVAPDAALPPQPQPANSLNLTGSSPADAAKSFAKGVPLGLVALGSTAVKVAATTPAQLATTWLLRKLAPEQHAESIPEFAASLEEKARKWADKKLPGKGPSLHGNLFGNPYDIDVAGFAGEMAGQMAIPMAGMSKAGGMIESGLMPAFAKGGSWGEKLGSAVLSQEKFSGRLLHSVGMGVGFHTANNVPGVLYSSSIKEAEQRGTEFLAGLPLAAVMGGIMHGSVEAAKIGARSVEGHFARQKAKGEALGTKLNAEVPADVVEADIASGLYEKEARSLVAAAEMAEDKGALLAGDAYVRQRAEATAWARAHIQTQTAIDVIERAIAAPDGELGPRQRSTIKDAVAGMLEAERVDKILAADGDKVRLKEIGEEVAGIAEKRTAEIIDKPGEWDKFRSDLAKRTATAAESAARTLEMAQTKMDTTLEVLSNRANGVGIRVGENMKWRPTVHFADDLVYAKWQASVVDFVNEEVARRLATLGTLKPQTMHDIALDASKGQFISGGFEPNPRDVSADVVGAVDKAIRAIQDLGSVERPPMSPLDEIRIREAVDPLLVDKPPGSIKERVLRAVKDPKAAALRRVAWLRSVASAGADVVRDISGGGPRARLERTAAGSKAALLVERAETGLVNLEKVVLPALNEIGKKAFSPTERMVLTLKREVPNLKKGMLPKDVLTVREALRDELQRKMDETDNPAELARLQRDFKVNEQSLDIHYQSMAMAADVEAIPTPIHMWGGIRVFSDLYDNVFRAAVKGGTITPESVRKDYVNRMLKDPGKHAAGILETMRSGAPLDVANAHSFERELESFVAAAITYAKKHNLPNWKVLKTLDSVELASGYVQSIGRAAANGQLVRDLKAMVPEAFSLRDNDRHPHKGTVDLHEIFKDDIVPGTEKGHKVVQVDARLGEILKNYLDLHSSKKDGWTKAVAANAWAKSWKLSFDLYHMVQVLRVGWAHGVTGFTESLRAIKDTSHPYHQLARKWVESGANLETDFSAAMAEMHAKITPENLPLIGAFNHFMWRELVPGLKFEVMSAAFDRYAALAQRKGITPDAAMRQIATAANEQFGAQAWIQHMRNPRTDRALRMLMLAPQWYETQLRVMASGAKDLAGGAVQMLPEGQVKAKLGEKIGPGDIRSRMHADFLLKYAGQAILFSAITNGATYGVLRAIDPEQAKRYLAWMEKHPLKAATGTLVPAYNRAGEPIRLGWMGRFDFAYSFLNTLRSPFVTSSKDSLAMRGSPAVGAALTLATARDYKGEKLPKAPYLELLDLASPMLLDSAMKVADAGDGWKRELAKQVGRSAGGHVASDYPVEIAGQLESLVSKKKALDKALKNPLWLKAHDPVKARRQFNEEVQDWLKEAQKDPTWGTTLKQKYQLVYNELKR